MGTVIGIAKRAYRSVRPLKLLTKRPYAAAVPITVAHSIVNIAARRDTKLALIQSGEPR